MTPFALPLYCRMITVWILWKMDLFARSKAKNREKEAICQSDIVYFCVKKM